MQTTELVDNFSLQAKEIADSGRLGWGNTMLDAAEALLRENAKLKTLLSRYRDETPLGHQPSMIAHLVDEALGRKS